MSKSIKFKNNTYLDSSGLTHNRTPLKTILTYSTSEQVCGTWIDGKPIYRRVIKGTGNDKAILTNFSPAQIIRIYGAFKESIHWWGLTGGLGSNSQQLGPYYDTSKKWIYLTGGNEKGEYIVIVEYTKT